MDRVKRRLPKRIQRLRKVAKQLPKKLSYVEKGVINISNESGERWKIQIEGPLLTKRTFTTRPRRKIMIEEETDIVIYNYYKETMVR